MNQYKLIKIRSLIAPGLVICDNREQTKSNFN